VLPTWPHLLSSKFEELIFKDLFWPETLWSIIRWRHEGYTQNFPLFWYYWKKNATRGKNKTLCSWRSISTANCSMQEKFENLFLIVLRIPCIHVYLSRLLPCGPGP
jgi:hypothetical protein